MFMNAKISECMADCQRRSAFTFLELLVVVGTVALLSVILLPALASTKPNGIAFQCLENQRRLAQAFVLYPNDNNGTIVPFGPMDGYIQPSLVNWDIPSQSAAVSLQNFQACVNSAANLLYPYGANVNTIHCPGDVRYRNATGRGWAYDSYSKTENVGGESYGNYWGQGATYTNISKVTDAAHTFAFREDVDTRSYNSGTWILDWRLYTPQFGHAESFTWSDPLPMYHGDVTTAAFVDGHAEFHKWTDRTLIQYGLSIAGGPPILTLTPPNPPSPGPDYEYIYQNFSFPGWQP
jgi:prepilin-type processing-associated H-X9-DG protein